MAEQSFAERVAIAEAIVATGIADRHPVNLSAGARAHLLAGVLAASDLCSHLSAGHQEAVVDLAGRRTACEQCATTLPPPVVPDDSCDLCGEKSNTFSEIVVEAGPLLVYGNLCPSCVATTRDPAVLT